MLSILFKAVSKTLLAFGENPKNRLAGKLGFIAILHTWDQRLNAHFHLHCLIPGGVLKADGSFKALKRTYLFNIEALSEVFRGKFLDLMTQAYQGGQLRFSGICSPLEKPERFLKLKDALYSKKWVVYIQKPIKRPEYVLEYFGRYTHRVAISNHRIVSVHDGMVTFNYKNRDTNQTMSCIITAVEFIRRFLLHSLPIGFMRIRHFGFLSNRNKKENIQKIRTSLGASADLDTDANLSVLNMMSQLIGLDITRCPHCNKGKMRVVAELPKEPGSATTHIIRPPTLQKAA
jgi:hypothetical protein